MRMTGISGRISVTLSLCWYKLRPSNFFGTVRAEIDHIQAAGNVVQPGVQPVLPRMVVGFVLGQDADVVRCDERVNVGAAVLFLPVGEDPPPSRTKEVDALVLMLHRQFPLSAVQCDPLAQLAERLVAPVGTIADRDGMKPDHFRK